jgi:ankyrin repeat protein
MKTKACSHVSLSACGGALVWVAMLALAAPAPAAEAPATKLNSGDFVGVIADTTQLLAARPDDPVALRLRGLARLATDDNAGALADLAAAAPLATGDDAAQAHIFAFVAQRRLGRAAEAKTALTVAAADWPEGWLRTVARYLTGALPTVEFYTQAGQGGPAAAGRTAAMQFFLGEELLATGDLTGARTFLESAAAGPPAVEPALARAALAGLEQFGRDTAALSAAASAGDAAAVRDWLARNRRLANGPGQGTTPQPLYAAIAGGSPECVRLLLEAGAVIGKSAGNTPSFLMRAAIMAEEKTVEAIAAQSLVAQSVLKDAVASASAAIAALEATTAAHDIQSAKERIAIGFAEKVAAQGDQKLRLVNNLPVLEPGQSEARLEVLRLLLEHKADVNEAMANGMTALRYAIAFFRSRPTVVLLLEHGAQPNDPVTGGSPPLVLASAMATDVGIVEELLKRGADARRPVDGIYPLAAAAESGSIAVVRALLAHGAEVNAASANMATAISFAARMGHADICQLLLEAKADPERPDRQGVTPLATAASNGNTRVAALLLAHGASIESRDEAGFTPLLWAVEYGHAATAKLLLDEKADPTARTKKGMSALHLAAQAANLELIRIFIGLGLDVNAEDSQNVRTPLNYAISRGSLEAVELLLASGARPRPLASSMTPLMLAASLPARSQNSALLVNSFKPLGSTDDWRKIAELLLAHGEDIKAQATDGSTALHSAAAASNGPVVALLLEKGAVVNATNQRGDTVLHFAARTGDAATVELLLGRGAKATAVNAAGEQPIHAAAANEGTGKVAALVRHGADPAAVAVAHGATPLHNAIFYNRVETVEYLLMQKVPLEAKDGEGQTPLALAALIGNPVVVKMLLARQASPAVRIRDEGLTPLHLAVLTMRNPDYRNENLERAMRPPAEKLEAARLLLDHGADRRIRSEHGFTPLDVAEKYGTPEMVELLKSHTPAKVAPTPVQP